MILHWIMGTSDPVKTLACIEHRFGEMTGRNGHILMGSTVASKHPDADAELDHLIVTEMGTLTGHVRCGPEGRSFTWSRGDVLLGPASELPAIIRFGLVGRRLIEVVKHPWAPQRAVIVGVEENGANMVLNCQEFSVPIAEAKEVIEEEKMI